MQWAQAVSSKYVSGAGEIRGRQVLNMRPLPLSAPPIRFTTPLPPQWPPAEIVNMVRERFFWRKTCLTQETLQQLQYLKARIYMDERERETQAVGHRSRDPYRVATSHSILGMETYTSPVVYLIQAGFTLAISALGVRDV